ncbi:MAG: response regulator [Candidatus Aureabacteria bacterium]|nr:response regulator [Candidatus Auribacterota bacterium]
MRDKSKYNQKLVVRVLLTFIIIIFIIVSSLSYLFFNFLFDTYHSELKKRGESLCSNLAFNSKYEVFIRDKDAIKTLLSGLLNEEDILFAYIEDEKGKVIVYQIKEPKRNNKFSKEIIKKGFAVNKIGSEFQKYNNDIDVLHLSRKITIKPEEKEDDEDLLLQMSTKTDPKKKSKIKELGYAHIGVSLEKLNERVDESKKYIFGLSILFILFFSFIATLFARSIVNPIITLVKATHKVSQGDLDFRAKVTSQNEIGLLTDSFNKMTEDLKKFRIEVESKEKELIKSNVEINKAHKEILEFNRDLEIKIKERTSEIQETNTLLRKRNEELQTITKELEESNIKIREADRLKSEFLANMSHELRTPLNSIIGFSALSLKDDEVLNMPNIQDNFEEIYKNGKQLLAIINDILDLSKVESGKMDFVKKDIDLREVITNLSKTLKVLKKDKEIDIKVDIEKDLPHIYSDPDRIRQVLLNIASNSVKFTNKGYIEIRAKRKNNYIEVAVEDTGIGIKEVDIPKVFESFRQIDGSSTRKEGGTGLGMTISRKFVEMMGGTIWIESEFGKGTTILFTIPVSFKKEESEKDSEDNKEPVIFIDKKAHNYKKEPILIIEDDMSAIKLYEKILKSHGYDVVWETQGSRAIDKVKEIKPFVIFLDIMLPDRSGWDILTELKTLPSTKNIPIVMSSILTEQNKGFALGAVEYLVKPVAEDDLLSVLKRIKLKGKKVIVIDDSHLDVLLVSKILEKWDYEIFKAHDGKEGLDKINQIMPHVIILDLDMPVMDGFQVVDKLKRREATKMIPVIIVTAKDLTEKEKKSLAGKIDALIMKSHLTEESLMETLFDVLKFYDFKLE